MKVILASAYDINPYKGSESGTGWNFILQISRFNKVVAVTRKNNSHNINKYIKENNIDKSNLSFLYYDLPYFLRFWKRGERFSFLYYNLWQMFLPLFIVIKRVKFDFTNHINFHADHVPSYLWLLGKPFIWGPINHNEPILKEYLDSEKEYIKDRLKFFIKLLRWNFDPFFYLCRNNAKIIIGSNSSVLKRLRIKPQKFRKISTISAKPQFDIDLEKKELMPFTVLSVGRLVSIKSFDVAIRAFDHFYSLLNEKEKNEVKYILIGDGPLQKKINSLVQKLNSKKAIKLVKWIDQEELNHYYKKASALLVSSHEGGGAVVAEAMSFGVPVVCFDNYGAGETIDKSSGIMVKVESYEKSYKAMGLNLLRLYQDKSLLSQLMKGAKSNFEKNLTWDRKGHKLKLIYDEISSEIN